MAAIVTMIAFVAAVNAAVFIEGRPTVPAGDAEYPCRPLGGLVGTAVMAVGIALLPSGPRKARRGGRC